MDKPTKLVITGIMAGLFLFIGFEILTFLQISPLSVAFNKFFSVVGIILFFISLFFLLSLRTIQE